MKACILRNTKQTTKAIAWKIKMEKLRKFVVNRELKTYAVRNFTSQLYKGRSLQPGVYLKYKRQGNNGVRRAPTRASEHGVINSSVRHFAQPAFYPAVSLSFYLSVNKPNWETNCLVHNDYCRKAQNDVYFLHMGHQSFF